jgi:C1A family cysteine protease
MTNEEYAKTLIIIIIPASADNKKKDELKAAPESIDWVSKGYVPAVRDQGSCGSCYTFAALAAVESRLLIAGSSFKKSNIDFSEQQLVDCSTDQGNKGCNGGSLVATFRHIKVNGIMKESDYPYKETEGTCAFVASKAVAKIGGQKTVTANSESALQTAVAEGPVAVAIDASTIKFQLYSSGVFDDSNCSSTTLNHGVAAVGYGTESGSDFWLVRNSWGSSWGQSGYIKMSRNKNNQCGIAAGAVYPTGCADA